MQNYPIERKRRRIKKFHFSLRVAVVGCCAFLASISNVIAQEKSTSDTLATTIDEVAITGTRAPLAKDKSARIVGVITKKDIASSGATTVNDLLKLAAGVDIRQRGGFGIQTDISINGGTFDEITILLNGVNINNPQTGHLAGSFPVSPEDIERIEILEGAAGRLFGSQAFSGAINIITHNVKENAIRANISGGSFGTFENGAGLALKTKKTSHYISGNYRRSDGGTDNSSFNQGRAFYNGKFKNRLANRFCKAKLRGQHVLQRCIS